MHLRTLGAIMIFFKWQKCFYWGKLYQKPAYFIVQLFETVKEMRGFLIMVSLCIIAFTNFFMIIQKNKKFLVYEPEEAGGPLEDANGCPIEVEAEEEPAGYVSEYLQIEFVDAFIAMYLLSLGEFAEMDGYSEGHDR